MEWIDREFSWKDIWTGVAVLASLVAITLLTIGICSTKNVDYYYLQQADQNHSAVCVRAHWTWNYDQTSYCTDDYNKALDFIKRANETIKK